MKIPSFTANSVANFTGVPLEAEQCAPSHVMASLRRLRDWLQDEDWAATVAGTALYAERSPRRFYRSLSPIARVSRGSLTYWFDGKRIHVRFRPDWLAALVDVGVLALAFAANRAVSIMAPGSRWVDAQIAFTVLALALPAVMLLVRFRFAAMLARAVWATNDHWRAIRRRGQWWRFAWNLAGGVGVGWVLVRPIVWFLFKYALLLLQLTPVVFQHAPSRAVQAVLYAVLAAAAICVLIFGLGSDHRIHPTNHSTDPNQSRD